MPLKCNNDLPHIMKYMGSKRNIIEFVVDAIDNAYKGGKVCDLFAGTSILSAALRNQVEVISNDIQAYSAILANTYLANYAWERYPDLINEIYDKASAHVIQFKKQFPDLAYNYNANMNINCFKDLEKAQQELIKKDFPGVNYYLFAKYYSGTYWSYEQCIWIDAIRGVAEAYRTTPLYSAILASLIFAMSYCSQSTGHFAQYRDATSESSMQDILNYRMREIWPLFEKKLIEFREVFGGTSLPYKLLTLDYKECLEEYIDKDTTVYADPPYCFVHYSRFYHAIETLIKYDYPKVLYKGRYRTDRHQSPFCIRTKVSKAFEEMFAIIRSQKANLVLSYSDTGMIELEKLVKLANLGFGNAYQIDIREKDHLHSTMGRREDKSRNVKEILLIAKER